MEYEYESAYTDGCGGIVVQWKEDDSKARVYLKISRTGLIEVQEAETDRKLGMTTEHSADVRRLRELFGITGE